MADVQLSINQGDRIYYYDSSRGGISRQWTFQGGTPATGSASGTDIKYYGVNYSGYDTGLVVTGAGGITAEAYKSGIVVVYPEIFDPAMVITTGIPVDMVSTLFMGKSLTFQVIGTVSSGIDSYSWTIPQLGPSNSPTVDYTYTDWYLLTGTYLGSPNSSYITNVTCGVVSVVGNETLLTKQVSFRKMGVTERVNYWPPGTYATSGKYYDCSVMSQRTSALGLGGNSLVIRIDFSQYSPRWNNTSFHSTQEAVYLLPNSPDVSSTYSPVKTNIILNGDVLVNIGATGGYSTQPGVMTGNYIVPNDIASRFASKFFITDQSLGGVLTALVDGNRKWNNNAVSDFMENKYYLSGSSKFIELGGFYQTTLNGATVNLPRADLASGYGYTYNSGNYTWDGGWPTVDGPPIPSEWFHGVSIPSSLLLYNLYNYTVNIDVRLKLRDSAGSIIDDFQFIISPVNGEGNTPDLLMITAGETSWGSFNGLDYLINSGIASRGGGLSNNIIFENNQDLSPYNDLPNGLYNGYGAFGALKMSIIDPRTSSTYSNRYIHSLEITWGTQMSEFIFYMVGDQTDFPTFPFASDLNALSTTISWTGLPSKITVPAPSYTDYTRGWLIGGGLS